MAAQPTPAHPATMEATLEQSPINIDSPLPEPIFTTPRILIRSLHPQDAEPMARHGTRPSIAKYMSLTFPSPYTIDRAHTWIAMNLSQSLSHYGIFPIDAPKELIGGIGLKLGADIQAHAAEVGYWISEDYAGRGLMTEILAAFTEWTFTSYSTKEGKKLTRLFAGVFAPNVASIRILEKCGYRNEGVSKGAVEKWGVANDLVNLGLIKSDWEEWKQSEHRTP